MQVQVHVPETWRHVPTAKKQPARQITVHNPASRYFHLETGAEIRKVSKDEWVVLVPAGPGLAGLVVVAKGLGSLVDALAAADPWIEEARDIIAARWTDAHDPTCRAADAFIARVRALRDPANRLGRPLGLREAGNAALAEDHAAARRDDAVITYYALRAEHVDGGGIAVAAERRAAEGDYACAIAWLVEARHSDFLRDDAKTPLADRYAVLLAAEPARRWQW